MSTTTTRRLFDRHFSGSSNAGHAGERGPSLRGQRHGGRQPEDGRLDHEAAGGHGVVDYRAANGESSPRCACDACVAGGLQRLGALG